MNGPSKLVPVSLLVLATALGVSSCASPSPATLRQLQVRAAFDLQCPSNELRLYVLDGQTKGVIGCGRRLTYVQVCPPGGEACLWMLDSPPSAPRTLIQYAHHPYFDYRPPPAPVPLVTASRPCPASPACSAQPAATATLPASARPPASGIPPRGGGPDVIDPWNRPQPRDTW